MLSLYTLPKYFQSSSKTDYTIDEGAKKDWVRQTPDSRIGSTKDCTKNIYKSAKKHQKDLGYGIMVLTRLFNMRWRCDLKEMISAYVKAV
jgi:hypothetical protein